MRLLPGRRKRSESMVFVIGVAVLLLIGAYMVPMRTSLAQGIEERTAVGWQAVMVPESHVQYYRMNFADGSFFQFKITGLQTNLFDTKSADGNLATAMNLPAVMQTAYRENPRNVERTLGTYRNVPSVLHPFSEEPIAYSAQLLQDLAKEHLNPSEFGGPNIPPGAVPVKKLEGAVLHIDTKSNNNTILQCKPGATPVTLKTLLE